MEKLFVQRGVRIHGYMLLGGRRILRERYYSPYGKEDNHRMYSITKSLVALGVGLLIKNNLVSLDDRICDYFPEKLPAEGPHPWCAELTIRDMLTMQTCHSSTTYKKYDYDDWTESFFKEKPDHVSGTVFSYDTSSAHVLCALVEKLSGRKMLDYMRQECLDEIGFSRGAYVIPDPVGVSQGGSGIMCTLEDVARVAYLCNHYGVLDGKELLPSWFVREAVSNLVPTDMQPKLDEQCGYGYFIWMPREEGKEADGFVLYGMGGQLAVCFPKYDFIYLTMADTIGSPAGLQILYDCFYDTIYPCLKERREDNPLAFEPCLEEQRAERERHYEKRCAEIREMTQGRTYSFYENAMGWKKAVFDWEKECLCFEIPAGQFTLDFSGGGWKQQSFLDTGYRCECRGMWKQGHFMLECFIIDEEQGHVRMEFAWKEAAGKKSGTAADTDRETRLSLRIVSTNEPFFLRLRKSFQGFASAALEIG